MSGKKFLLLLLLYVAYLLLGAAVFHYIEQSREIAQKQLERREEGEIFEILQEHLKNTTLYKLLPMLENYCGKSFNIDPNQADPYKWHFYNAVFFVITVVSTIGYGNLAPTAAVSRILMIFYALVGIPMNGILLKSLADYFAHFFLRARDKYRRHHHSGMSLAGSILLYSSLGICVFIVSPSFVFMYFEEWSFDEAIYYAFVSLTTIGFGDLVAGQEARPDTDIPYTVYKIFLIVWLVFGLGYLFMVLSFITDAMRSKRMAKLSKGMTHTPTKLWHGMVHDMPHLFRRVFNELYLLKVKPVYHGDDDSLCTLQLGARSASCPNLFWLDEECHGQVAFPYAVVVGAARRASRLPGPPRPRALSEVLPGRLLARRRSETELARIDRRATFADAATPTDAALDPAELLHEFMNALLNWGNDEVYSTLHKTPGTALPSGGYQGFADADILSSEWGQAGQAAPVPRLGGSARQRAKSLAPFSAASDALAEARFAAVRDRLERVFDEDWDHDDRSTLPADEAEAGPDDGADDGAPNNAEWTWSGTGASKRVHELIRARQNRRRSEAVIRRQQRQDRRMQELQDFERLQALEGMRQLAKEARQREKRLRGRTMSSGAADADAGLASPRPSTGSLMQRLAIPQRLKDLRRRCSLQPGEATSDSADRDFGGKRRSPSYDLSAPAWPSLGTAAEKQQAKQAMRTASVGDGLHGLGPGRRDSSIFRRNSATVHPMLQNTSLAEFLRVLQAVQAERHQPLAQPQAPATPGKTRKLGMAGLGLEAGPTAAAPNSIFSLFPGLLDPGKAERRRSSLRPSSPPPAVAPAPSSRRRMSFWPSFGSTASAEGAAANGLAAPMANGLANATPGTPRRKSSTARRLSTFFGGGSCTDPAPDQNDEAAVAAAPRATKRRRFSIWPALGGVGRGGNGDFKDAVDDRPPTSLATAEAGRLDSAAAPRLVVVPQITVTYINDADLSSSRPPSPPPPPPPPPPAAPRESLLRQALTGSMAGSAPGSDAARMRYPRISVGRGGRPHQSPVPGRRGLATSPLSTYAPAFRRRAMSESTRTHSDEPPAETPAAETYDERL